MGERRRSSDEKSGVYSLACQIGRRGVSYWGVVFWGTKIVGWASNEVVAKCCVGEGFSGEKRSLRLEVRGIGKKIGFLATFSGPE